MNVLQSSTRNALGNAKNSYQGEARRVLCVCSAGLLRSPTLAAVLAQDYGYNTRACGSAREFALIPISQALVHWADEIVFVQGTNHLDTEHDQGFRALAQGKRIVVMDIPDVYEYMEPELVQLIRNEYPTARSYTMDIQ